MGLNYKYSKSHFEKSRLNNPVIRFFNYAFWFLVFAGGASPEAWSVHCTLTVVIAMYLFYVSSKRVQRRVDFMEWDKGERKKKESFLLRYNVITLFISLTVAYLLTSGILSFRESDKLMNTPTGMLLLWAFALVVSVVNLIYTVPLWYPIFEEDLTIWGCTDKPQGWED